MSRATTRAPRATLINSYGPPETTIAVSAKTLTSDNIADVTTDVVPIGSPFAHVELWRTADGRARSTRSKRSLDVAIQSSDKSPLAL